MGIVLDTGYMSEAHLHPWCTHPTAMRPSITRAGIGGSASSTSTYGASGCVSGSIVGDASPNPLGPLFHQRLASSSRHSVSDAQERLDRFALDMYIDTTAGHGQVAASVAGEEKPPEPDPESVAAVAASVAGFRTEAEQAVRAEIDAVIQEVTAQLSSTRLYQNAHGSQVNRDSSAAGATICPSQR